MSIGIFELVNGVLTKKKIAGNTRMDAQLNANSRNGVQNRIITGEINDIKDDISTINTQLSHKAEVHGETFNGTTDSNGVLALPTSLASYIPISVRATDSSILDLFSWNNTYYIRTLNWNGATAPTTSFTCTIYYV